MNNSEFINNKADILIVLTEFINSTLKFNSVDQSWIFMTDSYS